MVADLAKNKAGEAAFISLRELPWHRQGVVVQEELAGREFIQAAGLDYEVVKCDLQATVMSGAERKPTGWDQEKDAPIYGLVGQQEVRQHHLKGVYRSDTGALFPGAVGDGFEIYQNREIIDFFEGLVKDRKIVYECAGALGQGEEMWVLANIPDLSMAIRGDENRSYMLIRNGHCGNATLQCFPTTIRVVCSNTMAMATTQRQADGRWNTTRGGYNIRHTRNMRDVVSRVQRAYGQVLETFSQQRELYEFLAGKELTQETKREFFRWFTMQGRDERKVTEIYAKREAQGEAALTRGEKTSISRLEAMDQRLEELFESPTNQQPGTRNTLYSALQTAIEYIDHERTTRCGEDDDPDYKRFESAIFGSGAALKVAATQQAVELALA